MLRYLLPTVLALCAVALVGAVPASAGGVATVTSPEGLNLRSAPSTDAAVVALIPYGSVLTLTGDPTPDHWYPVSFGALSGWASGSYMTPGLINPISAAAAPSLVTSVSAGGSSAAVAAAPVASSPSVVSTPPATMVVSTDALNLRTGPDTSTSLVVAMPQGSVVQVTGAPTPNNWYPVTFNGLSGWADGAYLTASSAAAASGSTPAATSFSSANMGKPAPAEAGPEMTSAPPGTMGKFIWPVAGRRITTMFKPIHRAIDIDQYPSGGNPIWAIADGLVTFSGGDPCCSYGLYVIIQHANGFSSLYAHFSSLTVAQGQVVRQGQQLGLSGNTGNSTGNHLHFAIFSNGAPLDPLTVLPGTPEIWPGSFAMLPIPD